MVDIHSHVLWGMDDGARSKEMSLEMLRMAAGAGTTDIVASPHSNGEFEYRPEVIAERMAWLAEQTGGAPKIHRGCDFHLSYDNVMGAIGDPRKFSINGGRYLLVECSDLHISGAMDKVLDQLMNVDLIPIVTHPERNPILRKETAKLERWVEQGCLVQVTALSILGGFGKPAQAAARHLMRQGLVHAIASDAHDPVHRHPKLDEAFAAVSGDYGRETAEMLFVGNPGKIIRGQYIETERSIRSDTRKWWQFWSSNRD